MASSAHRDAHRGLAFFLVVLFATTFAATLFLPTDRLLGNYAVYASAAFVVSWLLLPVATYADVRTVRSVDAGWTPSAPYWVLGCLVPGLNLSAVIAYLARRYETVARREAWDFWWRIAGACVAVLLLSLLVEMVLLEFSLPGEATVDAAVTTFDTLFFSATTFLVPAAIKYDAEYVAERTAWQPEKLAWTVGAAIPFVNIVVVLAYVAKRNPDSQFAVVDEIGEPADETGEVDSNDERNGSNEFDSSDERDERAATDETTETSHSTGLDERVDAGQRAGLRSDPTADGHVAGTSVDSNWWYLPLVTVALTAGLVVIAGLAIVARIATGSWWLGGLGVPGVFALVSIVLALALVAWVSVLAIYFDAQAIRATDANWEPSVVGYLLASVLVSPLVAALVYVLQRHRHLGQP